MRKTLFLFSLFLCGLFSGSMAQNGNRAGFEKAVKEIVTALKKKDNTALKKYIHPKQGVYLLFRNGVFDRYHHFSAINLNSEEYPEKIIEYAGRVPNTFSYTRRLPRYECGNDRWSRTGNFADTLGNYHPVSAIAEALVKYEVDSIPKAEINRLKKAEKGSRKLIIAGKVEDSLVLYLAFINGRWYLTVFDTVTTDCSA